MISIPFATFKGNLIAEAISELYGVVSTVENFIDGHVDTMKKSASATVRATGSVIEGAKFGFGIGYITPIVVIAVGQMILGNPLGAVGTVAKGMMLSNPIAMTCGAVGAIYYGWKALSEEERNVIISRITDAFEVGAELIKSMLSYVVTSLSSLLTAENIAEFRVMLADAAQCVGKSLSEITRSMKDRISDAATAVSASASLTTELMQEGASSAVVAVKKNVVDTAMSVRDSAGTAVEYIRKAASRD
jgi:hypothetical protein